MNSVMYNVQCTLYIVQCTLYIVHCTSVYDSDNIYIYI